MERSHVGGVLLLAWIGAVSCSDPALRTPDAGADGGGTGDAAVDAADGGDAVTSARCNLADETACGSGKACRWRSGDAATSCETAGSGGPGAGCTNASDCRAGMFCDLSGGGFCARWCVTSKECETLTTKTCVGFTPTIRVEGTTYGQCR